MVTFTSWQVATPWAQGFYFLLPFLLSSQSSTRDHSNRASQLQVLLHALRRAMAQWLRGKTVLAVSPNLVASTLSTCTSSYRWPSSHSHLHTPTPKTHTHILKIQNNFKKLHQWSQFLHTLAKRYTKVGASGKLEQQVIVFYIDFLLIESNFVC